MSRWWLVLVGVAACEKAEPSKPERDDDLRKEPIPVERNQRPLVYQPANIGDYSLAMDLESKPDANIPMKLKGTMDLAFTQTANPRDRDARITGFTVDIEATGQKIKLALANDELVLEFGGTKQVTKRGQTGGIVEVAALLDHPFTTLTFAVDNTVVSRGSGKNPLSQLGTDTFGTALIMFPDLPRGEVGVGHTWKFRRSISLGVGTGTIEVTYNVRYIGDGACPSGAQQCAILEFEATSANAPQGSAVTTNISYRFTGRVYFDASKGRVDESRVKLDMDVTENQTKMPIAGTFVLKPR